MAVQRFGHNEEADKRVERMLPEKDRAAVIRPTGIGKLFAALKYCQEHPNERICWCLGGLLQKSESRWAHGLPHEERYMQTTEKVGSPRS